MDTEYSTSVLAHLVQLLEVQPQVGVVDGVVLGGIVNVRHLYSTAEWYSNGTECYSNITVMLYRRRCTLRRFFLYTKRPFGHPAVSVGGLPGSPCRPMLEGCTTRRGSLTWHATQGVRAWPGQPLHSRPPVHQYAARKSVFLPACLPKYSPQRACPLPHAQTFEVSNE